MSKYMPTTDEVRDGFHDSLNRNRSRSAFDRWLTAHDRQVAEKAWYEGHKRGFNHRSPADFRNPYRVAPTASALEGVELRAIEIFEARMSFRFTEDYRQSREWSDAVSIASGEVESRG